ILLMTSRLCWGVGGMPGLGSRKSTTSSLKYLAKFGHELWYVTTFVPAYGPIFSAQRFSAAASLASKSARFLSKVALPAGSSSESLAAIAFAIVRPLFGASQ